MVHVCLAYPGRRVYKTGDETPVTEEHGHSGSDLARPGFLMVCREKVIQAGPRKAWSQDTRDFLARVS